MGRYKLPLRNGVRPDIWAVEEKDDLASRRAFCETHGIQYRVIGARDLKGFSQIAPSGPVLPGKRRCGHRLLRLVSFRSCPLLRGGVRLRGSVRRGRKRQQSATAKGRRPPFVPPGGAALCRAIRPVCHPGAYLHRRGLDGCRTGNRTHPAGHLSRQRGWGSAREKGISADSMDWNMWFSSGSRNPACLGGKARI